MFTLYRKQKYLGLIFFFPNRYELNILKLRSQLMKLPCVREKKNGLQSTVWEREKARGKIIKAIAT